MDKFTQLLIYVFVGACIIGAVGAVCYILFG